MSIIRILVTLLLVFGVSAVGYYAPNAVNVRFQKKYGANAWSHPLAIAEGVFLILFLFVSRKTGIQFWIPLGALLISYVCGLWDCCKQAKKCGAGAGDLVLGVFAQWLASCALPYVILLVIISVIKSNRKKAK